MFAHHAVTLDAGFPAARSRLSQLMRGTWLDDLSQDAYAEGLAGEIRVGPFGGVPGVSKLVRVSLLDPLPRDDVMVVPLRWEATGLMGRLFPVLDANLILSPDEQGRAVLRLMGVYRPPLAALGHELDQIVLHRVAYATIRSLVRRIAGPLGDVAAEAADAGAPAPGIVPGDVLPEYS